MVCSFLGQPLTPSLIRSALQFSGYVQHLPTGNANCLSWYHNTYCELTIFFSLFSFTCTILTTESLRHDLKDLAWPKRPVTNRLEPLARPEPPCTILSSHVHGPAPCGPITLSRIFYAFLPLLIFLFISALFFSLLFTSFLSCSPQFYLLLRLLVISRVPAYINHCTNSRKP